MENRTVVKPGDSLLAGQPDQCAPYFLRARPLTPVSLRSLDPSPSVGRGWLASSACIATIAAFLDFHTAMSGVSMRLSEIDLRGLGRFEDAPAAFSCTRFHLPERWDYVYTNTQALLRVNHDGSAYLQLDPPGGAALLRLERGHIEPSMFAWIVPDETRKAFSNFWEPKLEAHAPDHEPDAYRCTFSPDAARYHLENDGWAVDTELWVPADRAAVVMTIAITNTAASQRSCTLIPVVKPHMAPVSLAPWDVPALYQTCAFFRVNSTPAFWLETRNPGGDPSKRLRAAVVSDLAADRFEVCFHDFVGHGTWQNPQAIWNGKLARDATAKYPAYGKIDYPDGGKAFGARIRGASEPVRTHTPAGPAVIGQQPMAGLAKTISLAQGERFEFTVVFGKLSDTKDGSLPPVSEVADLATLLKPAVRAKALGVLCKNSERLFELRTFHSPDECMNRYVNEFLPLQLKWVSVLDRGWPTGMRGTRDAAQDATGMVALDGSMARRRLLEIFAVQRSDGWFLRQFSTAGARGTHDARPYVDSGIWVWEFLWEYVCYTRDFDLLKQKAGWLDNDKPATVLDHALQLFAYYLSAENRGEHGLMKIRAGDWNDSVNLAGLEGRGESVMCSCQVVLGLEQLAELLEYLGGSYAVQARNFRGAAEKLRTQIVKSALNAKGYFNAVFNDGGKWIFSPKDPDGKARINGPANSFAIIAGVAPANAREGIFDALNTLKGPHGWRLFHPPIGTPPIAKLGRIGAGDLAPGLAENGTPYNHGSQGFLGRAAWSDGRGEMLYQTLRYMFPYDQDAHPVERARTAPYGVVNHWREAMGQEGTGGDTFLSGSISTAIRNVYQGFIGFRPELERIVIDPCIPATWKEVSAKISFLGGEYSVCVHNPNGVESGVAELKVNGEPVLSARGCPRLGRTLYGIPFSMLKAGRDYTIDVRMG